VICPQTRRPCGHAGQCDPPYDCVEAEREYVLGLDAAPCVRSGAAAVVCGLLAVAALAALVAVASY
jgi:hypothetical protein